MNFVPVILAVGLACQLVASSSLNTNPLVLTFRPEVATCPRARILTTLSPIREFTICSWYRPLGISKEHNVLLDYEVPSANINELVMYVNLTDNTVNMATANPIPYRSLNVKYPMPLLKWQLLCFVWSSYTGAISLYMNGKLAGNTTGFKTGQSMISGGEMYIGADQTKYGTNDFSNVWNAFGELTGLHIWDRRLCASQIRSLASCNSTLEGNIVSWGKTRMIPIDGAEVGTNSDVCDQCVHP